MTDLRSEKGVALLMTLWVIVMLTGVVMSFSFAARTEVQTGFNMKLLFKAKYLAEAGINQAIIEILNRKAIPNVAGASNGIDDEEAWKFNGVFNEGTLDDDGIFLVKVVPENAKIDINFANEIILSGLLEAIEVDESQINIIVDCILDWKDSDNLHKLNGVEEDYYMSLNPPYRPADGNFTSVEELLLVKGITEEIYYGTDERKGLKDLITVHSASFLVDFNSAPKEVLMALPGLGEEDAQRVIDFRETNELNNINDVKALIPHDIFMSIRRYIGVGVRAARVFSIESVGHTEHFETKVGIRAAVEVRGDYKFLYYKTPELINYEDDFFEL